VANYFLPSSVFNFLIFFLIWWAGVEMAREFLATGDVTLRRQRTMLALLAIPAIWYAVLVWQCKAAGNEILVIKFPFMGFRYFAMSMVFISILFLWKLWQFAGFRHTIGLFEWVGSISYALYLFHYPLIKHLRLFAGDSGLILYTDLGLRILLAFLLAWLAEGLLQKRINSTTSQWLVSPPNIHPPSSLPPVR
jgi:peptidoglycan/LPS O-acetylase OafA/YrhL